MNYRLNAWHLLVGLLNGRNDAMAATHLERLVDVRPSCWTDLISLANEHLVTAPLWSGLRRCGLEEVVPTDAADYLQTFHEFNSARNRAILAQLYEFVAALNSSSIEPMPLKGTGYLVAGVFEHLGDRYLSDIDLLVPEDVVARAEAILLELGYRPASRIDYTRHHHLVPMVRGDSPVAIELHRAPVPKYAERAIPAEELWQQSVATEAGKGRVRLASPTDAAMLSFVHSQVVDRDGVLLLIPLRLFHDIHLVQERCGIIDWRRNLERAFRVDAERCLRRYLYTLERITGVDTGCDASFADEAYFNLCRWAIAWPPFGRLARRTALRSQRVHEAR